MSRTLGLKIKRILDVIGAVVLAGVLAPVMLLVAGLVWFNFGRPVLYKSPRIGQRASLFQIYKFRSMSESFTQDGVPLPDHERMTRFSRLLRSTSLDELPQLWNILRGDMSLIGPRPILTDYFPYLNASELRRLDMPPGVTGLAQVNGRNALDWDARLEMDVFYVNNWSLIMDLRIALKTIPVWILARGITAPGHVSSLRLDDHRRVAVSPATEAPTTPVLQDAG